MRQRSYYPIIFTILTVLPRAVWAQATDTLILNRQQLTDEKFKTEARMPHQSVLDLRTFISGNKDISLVRLFAKAKWGEPYVALRVSSQDKVLSGLTIKEAKDFASEDERSFFNHELTNFSRGALEKAELVFVGRVQAVPADQQVIKIHKIEVVFGTPSEIDQVSVALDQAAQDVGAAGDAAKQVQPQVVELGPAEPAPVPSPPPVIKPTPDPVPASRPAPTPLPRPEENVVRGALFSGVQCVAGQKLELEVPRTRYLIEIWEGDDIFIEGGRRRVRFLDCNTRRGLAWVQEIQTGREILVPLRDILVESWPVANAPAPRPDPDVLYLPDINNRTVEVRPGDRILLFIQGVAVPVTYVGPSRNPGEVMVRLPNQRDAVSRRLSSLRAERR